MVANSLRLIMSQGTRMLLCFILLTFAGEATSQTKPDAGAEAKARQIIESLIQSNCGQDSFSKDTLGGDYYWQYKKLSWKALPEKLTSAEKLNDVRWKGFLEISAEVYREHYPAHYPEPAKWMPWKDNMSVRLYMRNEGGKWSVESKNLGDAIGRQAPSCKELEAILPQGELRK